MELREKLDFKITVGIKANDKFNWYHTKSKIWILNIVKFGSYCLDYGYDFDLRDQMIERFNIDIVNIYKINEYLSNLKEYIITEEQLNAIDHIKPDVYFDFDSKTIYMNNKELLCLYNFLPIEWSYTEENPIKHIPKQYL
ncbi:MAG: hypothetical protein N4A54_01525 [Peptostreptococcaceae bacterium]|nr:hypothetical protein [Peptostreptococcaceae bacterium]